MKGNLVGQHTYHKTDPVLLLSYFKAKVSMLGGTVGQKLE